MIFSSTIAILYLTALYRKLGLLYDASVKLRMTKLHSPVETKWMKKWIKSVSDFRVDVASYYFIRKTTVASVLYSILNGAVTLLVAF